FSRPARIGVCIVVRKRGPATRTLALWMVTAPIFIVPCMSPRAWPALMIEECESVALLTPGIASKACAGPCKKWRSPGRDARSGAIQREQKDVLAAVSQLDGVQLVQCPGKQTRRHQDKKRHRDLGDHQHVLRTAARSAPAAVL